MHAFIKYLEIFFFKGAEILLFPSFYSLELFCTIGLWLIHTQIS